MGFATTVDPTFELADLYRRHLGFVWRSLLRLGVEEASVEDVAQNVFLIVGRKLSTFDADRSERAWLFGIARRVAKDHRRSRLRADARLRQLPTPTPPSNPEEEATREEMARLARTVLGELTEEHRLVLVLADIEGLTGTEVADALGIKMNTVYSRLRVARRRFEERVLEHTAPRREVA